MGYELKEENTITIQCKISTTLEQMEAFAKKLIALLQLEDFKIIEDIDYAKTYKEKYTK